MELFSAVQLAAHTSGVGVQSLVMVSMASAVLFVELPRRFDDSSAGIMGPKALAKSGAHMVSRCLPESGGFLLVVTAALLLRLHAPMFLSMTVAGRAGIVDPLDEQIWQEIVSEWPVLYGADTLLGFQAMLRLFVLVVATLRTLSFRSGGGADTESRSTPLSGMACALALSAMLARVALNTQDKNYWLEGPLGFELPLACEMAMVPLLSALAFAAARRASAAGVAGGVAGVAAVVSAATVWASQHYLNLADNPSIDRLFTLAHTLEVLAALGFLCSSVRTFFAPKGKGKVTASTVFIHVMMPLQQGLAAYFFLTSTPPDAMKASVGLGRPWCLLIIGNLVALGAYLFAAAMALASYLIRIDGDEESGQATTGSSNAIDLEQPLASAEPGSQEKEMVIREAIYL